MTNKKTEKNTRAKKRPESSMASDSPEADINPRSDAPIFDVTASEVKSHRGLSIATLLIALGGLGLGGYSFYLQQNVQMLPAYPSDSTGEMIEMIHAEIETVQAQLDGMQDEINATLDRLEPLEDQVNSAQFDGEGISANVLQKMQDQLHALSMQVTELESQPRTNAAPQGTSFEEASSMLKKLQYQQARDRLETARDDSPETMRALLLTIKNMDADNPALSQAATGLMPHIDALYLQNRVVSDFAASADEALAIRIEGEGWWQDQVNSIAKLVKVRKVDASGDSIAATIQTAQAALPNAPQKAVNAIQTLKAPASSHFAGWIPIAQRYAAAKDAYETMLRVLENGPTIQENAPAAKLAPEAAPAIIPDVVTDTPITPEQGTAVNGDAETSAGEAGLPWQAGE